MARQEIRIPARPPLSAPPPPRALGSPNPDYKKPKRKQITRKSIKKSQLRTAIVMIILLVIFFSIFYLATVLVIKEASSTMRRGTNEYSFEFNVPDIISSKVPVRIEVEASEPVECYLLSDEDYEEGMTIVEIKNSSINSNNRKINRFIYEKDLEKGNYVIISYFRNNDMDITLDYKITRYVLMPVLALISLIFIVLITLCIVRILLLEKKKKLSPKDNYEYSDYDRSRSSMYQSNEYDQADYDYSSAHETTHARDDSRLPPRAEYAYNQQDRHYDEHSRAPRPQPPHPRTQARTRAEPPEPHMEYDEYDSARPTKAVPATVTVPCKCGEVIVVKDNTRPLHITCSRCGRRGILEAKKRSLDEDIFY